MRVTRLRAVGAGGFVMAAALSVSSQQPKIGYDDTPMQPNGKWHVHDGARPQPKMVDPRRYTRRRSCRRHCPPRIGSRYQRVEDVGRRRGGNVADG